MNNTAKIVMMAVSYTHLDVYKRQDQGRANVLSAIELLVPVYNNRPASFNMQLFFNAKGDEIVNVFSQALPDEKTKAVEKLMQIDPANTTKYLKIQGN